MKSKLRNTYHKDGTVTFWSVYRQVWVQRARSISDRELAAMSPEERDKVKKHLTRAKSALRIRCSRLCRP